MYIWNQSFKGFLWRGHSILGIIGEFPWKSLFIVELLVLCLPFWWKWAPSWVSPKYFFEIIISCKNCCFRETALSGCFVILSTLSIFDLTWMKGFLEGSPSRWIFNKYLVLYQMFMKHQRWVGILERFSS